MGISTSVPDNPYLLDYLTNIYLTSTLYWALYWRESNEKNIVHMQKGLSAAGEVGQKV